MVFQLTVLRAEVTRAESAVANDRLCVVRAALVHTLITVVLALRSPRARRPAAERGCEMQCRGGAYGAVGNGRIAAAEVFAGVHESQRGWRDVRAESDEGFESADGGIARDGKRKGCEAVMD